MLLALALLLAAPTAPFQLDGTWKNHEVDANVGERHASITFAGSGGTFAYEDAGGLGVKITVRLQSVSVQGTQVRFALPGRGKLRHYSGRWDGRKISGTISSDPAGGGPLGTFELVRPVYEASRPLSPTEAAELQARQREAEAERDARQVSPGPSPPSSSPAPRGEIERKRDAGARTLDQRLGRLSMLAAELAAVLQTYDPICRQQGQPLYENQPTVDCLGKARDVNMLATAVGRGLDDAEDEARRNWVEPGTVRELRDRHGLGSSAWNELAARARQFEEDARRPR